MMLAIGVDVVDLNRWGRAVAIGRLDRAVLTSRERSRPLAGQARALAIKEALVKSLGSSVMLHDLSAIETPMDGRLSLSGSIGRRARQLGLSAAHCSTAVADDQVTAVVVVEGPGGHHGS